jgi:DNA-binding Lrp family transcriptional regulator
MKDEKTTLGELKIQECVREEVNYMLMVEPQTTKETYNSFDEEITKVKTLKDGKIIIEKYLKNKKVQKLVLEKIFKKMDLTKEKIKELIGLQDEEDKKENTLLSSKKR